MIPKKQAKLRHHPFVVPIVTFLVLFFVTIAGFISFNAQTIGASDTHIVSVSINGKQQVIPTRAKTVSDLLKRINVEIYEQDRVEPALDTPIIEDNFQVNVYRARPVTIIDGQKKIVTLSAEPTPRDVALASGVKLYPEDRVSVAEPEDILSGGALAEKVLVDRAVPIKLNLYGVNYDIRTHAKTISALVKEQNINAKEATIFPTLDTKISANSVVFVTDPGKQITLVEEQIPQGEQRIDDYNLLFGQTQVRDPGQPGKKVVVYEIAKNGSRKSLQEVVVVQPVARVIARGRKINTATIGAEKTSLMASAGIAAKDYGAADYIVSHESGWKPGNISSNGCYGLGQACPGSKLVNACPNWSNDPVCQLRFFSSYAGRYGGWQGAYTFWVYNHWW
jgi:uncharacterized protein YabE (DUF348 family)